MPQRVESAIVKFNCPVSYKYASLSRSVRDQVAAYKMEDLMVKSAYGPSPKRWFGRTYTPSISVKCINAVTSAGK